MSHYIPLQGFGGGGNPLNFKVVGGTAKPEALGENTIWANTAQKITGYIFSVTPPADPVEGMVWFTLGTSSPVEFNALKKNGLQVYPSSAKQYVGGSWVPVSAQTYQNGAWSDWMTYLFGAGDASVFSVMLKGIDTVAPTISDGKMVFTINDTRYNYTFCGAYRSEDAIDLSPFTTLEIGLDSLIVERDSTTKANHAWFFVTVTADKIDTVDAGGGWINTLCSKTVIASKEKPGNGILSADISSFNGDYYIYVGTTTGFTSLPSGSFDNNTNGVINAAVEFVRCY